MCETTSLTARWSSSPSSVSSDWGRVLVTGYSDLAMASRLPRFHLVVLLRAVPHAAVDPRGHGDVVGLGRWHPAVPPVAGDAGRDSRQSSVLAKVEGRPSGLQLANRRCLSFAAPQVSKGGRLRQCFYVSKFGLNFMRRAVSSAGVRPRRPSAPPLRLALLMIPHHKILPHLRPSSKIKLLPSSAYTVVVLSALSPP